MEQAYQVGYLLMKYWLINIYRSIRYLQVIKLQDMINEV